MKKSIVEKLIMISIVLALILASYFLLKEKEEWLGHHVLLINQKENLKKSPKLSSTTLLSLEKGTPVLLESKVTYLRQPFYKVIFYRGHLKYEGFVRINKVTFYKFDKNFEKTISQFPISYKQSLRYLHVLYPKWTFQPIYEAIDFHTASINYQKNALIDTNKNSLIESQKVIEGDSWRKAHIKTVAYYFDPRNALDSHHILMFEKLTFHKEETIDVAKKMLKDTYMQGIEETSQKRWAQLFYEAAKTYNISLSNLIARAIVEQGAITSKKGGLGSQGKIINSKRYYNIFNIGANTGANQGLEYAYKQGWDSREKAILGGAKYLESNYIRQKQDSLYLQRFDIYSKVHGSHSYMTNISAAFTEAARLYERYEKIGTLQTKHELNIPIYSHMPLSNRYPDLSDKNYNHSLYTSLYYKDISKLSLSYNQKKKIINILDQNHILRENVDYYVVNDMIYGINNYYGQVKNPIK